MVPTNVPPAAGAGPQETFLFSVSWQLSFIIAGQISPHSTQPVGNALSSSPFCIQKVSEASKLDNWRQRFKLLQASPLKCLNTHPPPCIACGLGVLSLRTANLALKWTSRKPSDNTEDKNTQCLWSSVYQGLALESLINSHSGWLFHAVTYPNFIQLQSCFAAWHKQDETGSSWDGKVTKLSCFQPVEILPSSSHLK